VGQRGVSWARWVREAGVGLVFLPAYSPELNPVARVFCELRCCVAGVVYETIEAKMAAVEGALEGLLGSSGGVLRLVGWERVREALEGLLCD
jgi:hypothetical protein